MKPIISLLHATARVTPSEAFPRGWRDAHDTWLARCDHPERVEYVVAVHESRCDAFGESDLTGRNPSRAKWHDFCLVRNHNRDCVVDQINAGFLACEGKLIVGPSDDFFPPEHWDTLLLEALEDGADYPEHECLDWPTVLLCASTDDVEYERRHMISCAVTRSVFERRGYALDPRFESMFADNWFSVENRRDEAAGILKVIERFDIRFEHRRQKSDEIYELQNAPRAYQQGYVMFRKLAEGARVIALMVPGETFSHRVMFGLFDVLESLWGSNFIVERFGAHTSNVYATRIELADAALKVSTNADFILSVDDDNVITPQNVSMLIADLDAHPELDWVGGWCWCDTGDYENNPFRMSCGRQGPKLECKFFGVEDYLKMKATGKLVITSDDLAPDALWSGFPVILMRRSMLERLGWEAFRPMVGEYHRGFTSEDTTFFYRAHQTGLKGAIDLRVKVPHLKLRAIEPQILPAEDREKVMQYLQTLEDKLSGVPGVPVAASP